MAHLSLRSGAAVTVLLLVIAAIVGGGVLYASSRSGSGSDITTAALVPADARVYGVINTDLTSSQWVNAFRLAERLGQQKPEQKLHETANSSGDLSWQSDVVPFLGGDAAVYLRSAGDGGNSPAFAIVARCKDAGKAMNVLLSKAGGSFSKASHAGTSYQVNVDQSQFIARLGDHLVVSTDEESLFAVLDVHAGKQKSMAGVAEFKSLRDKLNGNLLSFFYIDGQSLADDAFAGSSDLQDTLSQIGADFAPKPLGLVVSARGNGLQMEAISTGKADSISPLLRSHQSRFAKLVSADTAVFISTTGLTQTYDDNIKSNRRQIDDAIAKEGEYRGLDDALKQLGKSLGLNSLQDLIKLFAGETAVAVQVPGSGLDSPQFVLLAEVQDEKQAHDVMANIAKTAADSPPRTAKVAGADVTTFKTSGNDVAYVVTDGYAAVGTAASVRSLLEKRGPVLADLPGYRDTGAQISGGLGTFAYVDLASLLRKGIGGSGELGQAEKALEGLMINLVGDHDLVRLSGAVSVGK